MRYAPLWLTMGIEAITEAIITTFIYRPRFGYTRLSKRLRLRSCYFFRCIKNYGIRPLILQPVICLC